MPGYAELQVTSNYSFLRGASHVEELFLQAKMLGLQAMAVTDHNTLAGIARAHARAEEVGIRLIVGCRLDLRDGLPLLVYPTDRAAYSRLCRLLTLGKGRAGRMAATSAGGIWSGWERDCCSSCCRMRPTRVSRQSSAACGSTSTTAAICS
jgi:DNA polymerase III alpha subunit